MKIASRLRFRSAGLRSAKLHSAVSQIFNLSGCLLAATVLMTGCLNRSEPQDNSPPAVTVQPAKSEPVTDYLELTGTAAASKTVDLVARVPGYLDSVHFEDGTYVDKGQLLFVIEPKPYEEQLALSEAQLKQAQSEYDRQQGLIKQNATSLANLEKWQSQRDQAAAQVELARLNLSYTKVTAPFDGRIGRRLVDPGNLVGAGGMTKLATINQLAPIYVYFNLNERDALRLRTLMEKHGIDTFSQVGTARVEAALSNDEGFPHEGVLDFADSSVSLSTGTIQLRARFPNQDRALFPGLFVKVRIAMGDPQPMVVIPDEAVNTDQQGDYVLVLDAGDVVRRKNIRKGPLTPEGRAIADGLSAGDRVIVQGLQQARPGEKASVTPATAGNPRSGTSE